MNAPVEEVKHHSQGKDMQRALTAVNFQSASAS